MSWIALLLLVVVPFQDEPIKRAVFVIETEGHYKFNGADIVRADIPVRLYEALRLAPPDEQQIHLVVGEAVGYGTVRDSLVIYRDQGYDWVKLNVRRGGGDEALVDAKIHVPADRSVRTSSGLVYDPPEPLTPPRGLEAQPPPPPSTAGRAHTEISSLPDFASDDTFLFVRLTHGAAVVNGKPVALKDLQIYLRDVITTWKDRKYVGLDAAADMRFGEVADAMINIEEAGAELVLLVIDKIEGPTRLSPRAPRPPMPGSVGGDALDEEYVPPPPAPLPKPPSIQRVSGGVLASRATERPQPDYPPMAKAASIEGAVVVEVTVSEDGQVISARALSGHPLLRDSAVTAARQWKFKPTLLSGHPVKVIGTITFRYTAPPKE